MWLRLLEAHHVKARFLLLHVGLRQLPKPLLLRVLRLFVCLQERGPDAGLSLHLICCSLNQAYFVRFPLLALC